MTRIASVTMHPVSVPLKQVLWTALASGEIDTVATDHAPFDFNKQKEMGRGDFTKIPNGIPSIENRIQLLEVFRLGLQMVCNGKPGCFASLGERWRLIRNRAEGAANGK